MEEKRISQLRYDPESDRMSFFGTAHLWQPCNLSE